MMLIYLIGSLRDPKIVDVANALRETGVDIHDDWWSAGREADDYWKQHQQDKGLTYKEALKGPAAQHVFSFDKKYLDLSDGAVLIHPAGKSCHLEFGYIIGSGKPGWILLDNPDRWDVMMNFATDVFTELEELKSAILGWSKKGSREAQTSTYSLAVDQSPWHGMAEGKLQV